MTMKLHAQGLALLIVMLIALWITVRMAGPVLDEAWNGDEGALQAETRDDALALGGSPDELPLTIDEVRELQAALVELGYEPGPIDGVVGPATSDASEQAVLDRQLDPSIGYRGLLEWLQAEIAGIDPTAPPVATVDPETVEELVEESPVAVG